MAEGAGEFIETERKYDAEAGFALPDLAGLDGVAAVTGPQTYRLRAIYFDTTDLRLAAAKITLRRRTGGTDAGWHLKLPAGADSRREVHAPLGRRASSVPARLAELVARWTGGQPLRPIARLATTRRLRRLDGPGGTGPGGTGMPEWREASRWREIEIELVTGHRGLLDSAGGLLRRAGAAPSAAASKLSRLLASAPGAP